MAAEIDGSRQSWIADCAVVAAGPWAGQFLGDFGIDVQLTPVLEQITYVRGGAAFRGRTGRASSMPPSTASSFGFYAMPTPGIGYKVGHRHPARAPSSNADLDRDPDPARERETVDRVRHELPTFDATVVRSEICAWTDSPDDRFLIDRRR